jgi:hypothetical protein
MSSVCWPAWNTASTRARWMRRPPSWNADVDWPGTPVTALLRPFRLGQGVVLDRLRAEMPRLTKDAESVSSASRLLLVMANG